VSREIDVVMPPLGDAAGELVVSAWLHSVGDEVTKGEALFQVETDKVEVTVEALDSGTLGRILTGEGEAAEVGQAIAVLVAGE
jgi:pyruvate/2-oxoglutarate dehydrogenase complex dihydrolipoamide acyltransferase (E2) component